MRVVSEAGTIELGTVEAAPTIGITDYSRRVTDDYGVTTVVKRGFARRMSVRLAVPFGDTDRIQRALADLRATPATWIADDGIASLSVRGLYKEFEVDHAVAPLSYCTLTVEGLADDSFVDDGTDPAPAGHRSTLQLLEPIAVTDDVLQSSTVAEDDAPAWGAGATYAASARVNRGHRLWESLAGGNVGNDPATSTGKWLDVGPTSRWAMFDQALGSVTTASAALEVVLRPTAPVSGLAILDTNAASVRVQAPGYDRTQAVADGAASALFLDLAVAAAASITVTLTPASTMAQPRSWDDGASWNDGSTWRDTLPAGDGTVQVGTLLLGQLRSLGITEASPTSGITDYSRKETDQFGEVTIVPRAWAKRMAARALIRTDAVDQVAGRIAAVRALPSLWLGDAGIDSLTIYGFFKDFSIEIGESVSKLSLTIEGLSTAGKVTPIGGNTGPVDYADLTDKTGTKPADNATNTRDPSAPFGPGKTVGDVLGGLTNIDKAIEDFRESLEGTQGGAVQAAIDARDASIVAAQNSATARDQAQAAREAAENAYTLTGAAGEAAQNAKAAAEAAAAAAARRASDADGYAQTASGQATIATQKADAAGQSATNASASATTASTKASEASQSATTAVTAKNDAAGSAASAASSATVAATTYAKAIQLAGNGEFDKGLEEWVNTGGMTPIASSYGRQNVVRSNVGLRLDAMQGPKVSVLYADQRFRLRASWRAAAGGDVVFYVGTLFFDASDNILAATDGTGNYPLGLSVTLNSTVHGWLDRTTVIGVGLTAPPQGYENYGGTVGIPAGTVYFRPVIYLNYADNPAAVVEIDYFTVEDITSELRTAAFASAAATSAATASASQTAAGQSATAAQGAQTAAETARGQAQAAQGAAATSKTDAAGSASSAASSATVAASARDDARNLATDAAREAGNAGRSASAASTSASSAAASLTAADQRASAAESSRTDAQTAAGQASTYRDQASTSASSAAGSANTASTQARLAAVSATTRGLTKNADFTIGPDSWIGSMQWFGDVGDAYGVLRSSEGLSQDAYSDPIPINGASTYRLRARFASRGYSIGHYIGVQCLNAQGGILGNVYIPAAAGQRVGYDWHEVEGLLHGFAGSGGYASGAFFWGGTTTVRLLMLANYPVEGAGTSKPGIVDLDYLYLEEYSAAADAASYASAANTSASTASTKAGEAGASASAASNSAQQAQSFKDAASTSAQSAQGSAAAADGSQSSAATYSQQAAGYRDQAVNSAAAAKSSADTAANATGAMAQRLDRVETDVGTAKSSASSALQSVSNVQTGYSAARVAFVADAGGGVARFTLTADNYGAGWELTGNGRIGGNLVVDGTITQAKVAPNAITSTLQATGMSDNGISAGYTGESGHVSLVSAGGSMKVDVQADGSRASGAGNMRVQLFARYNGSDVAISREVPFPTSTTAVPVCFWQITSFPAGMQVEFFLRFYVSAANTSWNYSSAAIAITELKR